MEKNTELFVYNYGLACLAVVFIIEAVYILQFATNNITIDPKQFDLMLLIFSIATVVGGILAWHYKYFDLASILLLIGLLEAMFGYIEYVEGAIITITFVDYVFVALMALSSIMLAISKRYGISILALLSALMFFSFNLNKMFGVSDTTTNWAVVIFGIIAGVWCMVLMLMKYLQVSGIFDIGLFSNDAFVKTKKKKKTARKHKA